MIALPTPDPASPDPEDWPVGRLLSAASRRVEREWDAHLAGWGLTHAAVPVLAHLLAGPRSQRELAAASGVTEQTMSRVIARLERTGHVRREAHAGDHRRVAVSLTESGRTALLEATAGDVPRRITVRGLSPEQVDQLRSLLLLLVDPVPERAEPDRPDDAAPAGARPTGG